MKIKLLVFLLCLFFMVAVIRVQAETTSTFSATAGENLLNHEKTSGSGIINTVHQTIKTEKENFLILIHQKQEEASIAARARREEFKKRLAEIRDQKRQLLVSSINTKISTYNKNNTDRFAALLDKLQTILDTIKTKADTAKSQGLDTTALNSAISQAQAAIDAAKTIVTNQASKQYVLQITSDTTLKTTIGPTVSQFRTDLMAAHKAIIDAKQAVMNSAMELAKIAGGSTFHLHTPGASESGERP